MGCRREARKELTRLRKPQKIRWLNIQLASLKNGKISEDANEKIMMAIAGLCDSVAEVKGTMHGVLQRGDER